MPWKESQALEQRNGFITEWSKGEQSITELSRSFEISRKTAYKWLERFERTGRAGLANTSRAPHHSPQAISEEKSVVIVTERQEHPTWGARKIVQSLMRQAAEGGVAGGQQYRRSAETRRLDPRTSRAPQDTAVYRSAAACAGSQPGLVCGFQGLVSLRRWRAVRSVHHHRRAQSSFCCAVRRPTRRMGCMCAE